MSTIKSIDVQGVRGFAENAHLDFALPVTGIAGSGITLLTGPNNSGKSSIIECIQRMTHQSACHLSQEQRNSVCKYRANIKLVWSSGKESHLNSLPNDPGQLVYSSNLESPQRRAFVIGNVRTLPAEIATQAMDRHKLLAAQAVDHPRSVSPHLKSRMIAWNDRDRSSFYPLFSKVFGKEIEFLNDGPRSFVRYNDYEHPLAGLGDGVGSLATLIDGFADADGHSVILIDEPERSLHPSVQKRLMKEILRLSDTTQFVISTHSPYFLNWDVFRNGGALYRFSSDSRPDKTRGCYAFRASKEAIGKLLAHQANINNPHLLGTVANEIFFLEDHIVVVEGQEDVVMLGKIAEQLSLPLRGEFFGWGAGGADNVASVLELLQSLGFRNVHFILDGNKKVLFQRLCDEFRHYSGHLLPVDDIRDKPRAGEPIAGLCTSGGTLKAEFEGFARELIEQISGLAT